MAFPLWSYGRMGNLSDSTMFTRQADGTFTASHWPDYQIASWELLRRDEPGLIDCSELEVGGLVTFLGGQAVYLIVGDDPAWVESGPRAGSAILKLIGGG